MLVALPVMQTFVCATVTVAGRLLADFHYCPDDVTQEEAAPIVAEAEPRLRDAASSPAPTQADAVHART